MRKQSLRTPEKRTQNKPKQTQSKPNFWLARAAQTQNKPKQTQANPIYPAPASGQAGATQLLLSKRFMAEMPIYPSTQPTQPPLSLPNLFIAAEPPSRAAVAQPEACAAMTAPDNFRAVAVKGLSFRKGGLIYGRGRQSIGGVWVRCWCGRRRLCRGR